MYVTYGCPHDNTNCRKTAIQDPRNPVFAPFIRRIRTHLAKGITLAGCFAARSKSTRIIHADVVTLPGSHGTHYGQLPPKDMAITKIAMPQTPG
jgi:hypothetical protein